MGNQCFTHSWKKDIVISAPFQRRDSGTEPLNNYEQIYRTSHMTTEGYGHHQQLSGSKIPVMLKHPPINNRKSNSVSESDKSSFLPDYKILVDSSVNTTKKDDISNYRDYKRFNNSNNDSVRSSSNLRKAPLLRKPMYSEDTNNSENYDKVTSIVSPSGFDGSSSMLRNKRRPQSLSSESERLIQKMHSYRMSSDLSTASTPLTITTELSSSHSTSILHEVHYLKLMLLKLRRHLSQETEDGGAEDCVLSEFLFRNSCSLDSIDVSKMNREELEENYRKLIEKNLDLEKLLQSRERTIAKMYNDQNQATHEQLQSLVKLGQ